MVGYFSYTVPPVSPSDRAMLERVLVRYCRRNKIALSSFDASDAAVALTALFEHGMSDERRLYGVLSGGRPAAREIPAATATPDPAVAGTRSRSAARQ